DFSTVFTKLARSLFQLERRFDAHNRATCRSQRDRTQTGPGSRDPRRRLARFLAWKCKGWFSEPVAAGMVAHAGKTNDRSAREFPPSARKIALLTDFSAVFTKLARSLFQLERRFNPHN
ncbi:hypothetical protein, partial [Geomicrobium sp. JCM 19039]|uniref:hypothetical protein n=1 Tax=Geomicrobium sp. JCM 19039 TaxID=1460636 RepID=UPI0005AB350A